MAALRLAHRVLALLLALTPACRSAPSAPVPPSAPPARLAAAPRPVATGVRLVPGAGAAEIGSFALENGGLSENLEVGRPGTERQVVLPFTVEGLDAAESAALIDALKSRVCPFRTRALLLGAVERTAAPEALPRLLDLPVVPGEPFDQRLAPLQVLARSSGLGDLLVRTVEHGEASIAVPVAVALLRETSCAPASKRCEVAAARLAASRVRDPAARAQILDDARDRLGVGLSPLGEDVIVSEECTAFLARLAPLLRFARPAGRGTGTGQPGGEARMTVRYGASSIEPYRAPLRE
jgi:hypothetical protein